MRKLQLLSVAFGFVAMHQLVGCASDTAKPEIPPSERGGAQATTSPASEFDTLPAGASKQDRIRQGQQLIDQGKQLRESAMKMSSGEMLNGLSKSELLIKADKMVANGTTMKQRAMRD